MFVRKARAGAASLGYVWERDGQVLDVADEHGFELLAIRDGGFSEVHPSEVVTEPEPTPVDAVTEPVAPEQSAVSEPDAAAAVTEPEPTSDVVEVPAEPVTEPALIEPTPAAEEKPKRAPRQTKAKDTPAK